MMKSLLTLLVIFMLTPTLTATMLTEQTLQLPLIDDNEGNRYKTVQIGDQIWMAENLRATKFQDGSSVTTGYVPDDNDRNLLTHGRLYSWQDVVNPKNLCPKGWRVATDEDWQKLEQTIGVADEELASLGWRGDNDLAITLKLAQPNSLLKKFDQKLINKHGFGATPAGVKIKNWYLTQGMYSEFWTSTSASTTEAFARTLAYSWWNTRNGQIRRATLNKDYMFSVRCIKIT